jgi:hypothetical protein
MTSAPSGTKPPSPGASAVIAISVALAMGLGGLAFYLRMGALKAEGELVRSKEEFEKMIRMKRQIEELKKNAPRLPAAEKGGEDLLQLLASKARQANIPQNMLTTSRNPDRKEGGWKEVTYTVTLRAASKENLVLRSSVADFLSLVEKERPSVKAKNLSLTFSGNDFTSATITFSLFQRESS